ncbi:hypothetical protein DIPPA_05257 [Diplonema papillatum]|nr:hypothetical protein DIPPA_05257 [Diplonema papillatum]
MQQNALRLKKVGRVINTQNFVAICHHIMAAAHHDRSIVRFTQEQQERAALHDQGTRDLLQNAFNLTSDEVINEIFSIMVAHTRTLTRQKIQGSRYVSFMTDECQDLKKRAQYAVFFKVLEGGLITEVFWDLQAKKSADGSAPELFKHLVKMTDALKGVWSKVVGVSTDGANVMKGHLSETHSLRVRSLKKGPMFALFLYEVTLPVVAHFSSALQKASSFLAQVVSLKGHYKKKILDIAHEPKQYTKYFNCHMVLNGATTGIFQQPWATHEELTTWHHSVAVPYLKALAKAFDEELGMSACLQAFSLYDPKGPTFANGKIDLVAAKKELGHILAHYSGPHTFKNCSEEKTDIVACGPFLSENRRTALLHELEPFCAEIERGSGIPRSAMEAYLNAWIASPRTLNFATWPEYEACADKVGVMRKNMMTNPRLLQSALH